ncbi:MAG: CocE/NonD family hydrolase, partial [Bacteroidales bacterium]|nr:CocE/NonD family hydrolase [Bacteroidales bacterium]
QTVMFTMEDGTKLATDIFLPVTQDSMITMVDLPGFGPTPVQIIRKGTQYLMYDSINGEINENPYQLPVIFTRTPYSKEGSFSYGNVVSILGYSYAMQDMRGCYESEGVYLPMYSDSWNKNPYHPNIKHLLDITEFSDPNNGNKHEDGYQSIQFFNDSLTREYDIDGDDNPETFILSNGSIGMFGASALGNSQYTAAAAHKINPDEPGLKSLLPIVASADHYRVTEVQNGVYRYAIVNNWISGQIGSINDADLNAVDQSIENDLHSFTDYGLSNEDEASDICLSSMIDSSSNGSLPGYYPNSPFRASMDASYAPVNEFGEGDADGTFSRFTNMDVPIYHLTGWWDIFIDGQINTFNQVSANINDDYGNKSMQKIIIGPWAHQTMTTRTTGDVEYPENVLDIVKLDISNIEEASNELNIFESEVYKWFRHTLNEKQGLGDPKFIIPEANEWQELNAVYSVRIPSEDYILPYAEFIAYLAGLQGLDDIPFEISTNGNVNQSNYDIPPMDSPFLNLDEVPENGTDEYFQNTENVRFYVAGPVEDGVPENIGTGNYWFKTDSFPFVNSITYTDFFLHGDESLDQNEPETDEGSLSFMHDPDIPVFTVGGANMTVTTPDGSRKSQGQMNLANPEFADLTMNHSGVISFTTGAIEDSICIIGFPKARLYASSSIEGSEEVPTDTDFFVRVLDVYPDGRELFVVEGAVNARAREYARSIFEGEEDPNAEFSNIISDSYYEYEFKMMPIAYTFGHGHQIKILISSGNFPRYMSNANLPINDGEFFRREPGDGQSYEFNGVLMDARTCTNSIAFSPNMKSVISFPVFGGFPVSVEADNSETGYSPDIYPNPSSDKLFIRLNNKHKSEISLFTIHGVCVLHQQSNGLSTLDISQLPDGIYVLRISNSDQNYAQKIVIQN